MNEKENAMQDSLDQHAAGIPAECWADGQPPKHRAKSKLDLDPMLLGAIISAMALMVLMAALVVAWFNLT